MRGTTWDRRVIILFLALAAAASVLFPWLLMATSADDMEASESPLVMAAARQLSAPGALYGAYARGHHLVLIHAPLYYRLTAAVAWVVNGFWGDALGSTLVVGRSLSGLGFAGILVGLYRLARLDGAGRLAGIASALFFAAAPIQGGLAFEVRPDMFGSALVFLGLSLGLEGGVRGSTGRSRVEVGFAILGLAVCVKQQNLVVVVAAATGLAVIGREFRRRAAVGLATAIGLVALILGVEEWLSGGLMSRSIVVAAASVGRVHPATWWMSVNLLLAMVWKNVGPILITTALALGVSRARDRMVGRFAGGLVIVLSVLAWLQMGSASTARGGLLALGLVGLLVLLPILSRRDGVCSRAGVLDRVVMGLLVVELVLVAALARASTGAWYNYAITSDGLACVLAGRLAGRLLESGTRRGGIALLAAGTAAFAFAITDVRAVRARRAAERDASARVVERVGRPASELYFADRPGDNRVFGARELVFDPWLISVFEAQGLAEPRSEWLARALERGPITVVAVAGERTSLEGLARDLPGMGYRVTDRVGIYRVWRR